MKPYHDHGGLAIYHGSCLEVLAALPDNSVHCCVTSPPYWGLRSYLPDGHPDKALELGLEETPDAYVSKMVAVFREVRRVLRDDGTCWLNLGDSYASDTKGSGGHNPKQDSNHGSWTGIIHIKHGLKPKDLVGIPWRVAFALQADGWWLRQDIIWHKPNPMPESVTDRCTKAHEYVFLLAKSERYYYDNEAIKDRAVSAGEDRGGGHRYNPDNANDQRVRAGLANIGISKEFRNLRSVWTVATMPYSGAHFATFPPALIVPCILAGTSERGCCPNCGAPWVREVERTSATPGQRPGYTRDCMCRNDGGRAGSFTDHSSRTLGWSPGCKCGGEPVPCTVLDPFFGTGTTAFVALEHGRHAIGIELNEDSIKLAIQRNVQMVLPL